MPKELIVIKSFDKGLVTNADPKDLGDGIAVYSNNIEPQGPMGQLKVIKHPTEAYSGLTGFVNGKMMMYDPDKYALLVNLGSRVNIVEDFYGTPIKYGTGHGTPVKCYTPYGSVMYMGRGDSVAPAVTGYSDRQRVMKVTAISYTLSGQYSSGLALSDYFPEILIAGEPSDDHTLVIKNPYWIASTDVRLEIVLNGATKAIDLNAHASNLTKWHELRSTASGSEFETGLRVRIGNFNSAVTGSYVATNKVLITITTSTLAKTRFDSYQDIYGHTQAHSSTPTVGKFIGKAVSEDFTALTSWNWLLTAGYYTYYFSLLFNGVEETGLEQIDAITFATNDGKGARLTVSSKCETVSHTPGFEGNITPYADRRFSGVNFYRAKAGEFPRLVGTLDPTTGYEQDGLNEYVIIGSGLKITLEKVVGYYEPRVDVWFEMYDYGVLTGATYEANTGISYVQDKVPMPNYSCADVMDGFMLIGGCTQTLLSDAPKMVFRSKQFRFSMYDWANDFQVLTFVPTAISHHKGRWVVFGADQMAVINNNNLMVEDSKMGCGVLDQSGVINVQETLFWANRDNAYMLGDGLKTISDSIKEAAVGIISWRGVMSSGNIVVAYNSKEEHVLFLNEANGAIFVYSPKTDRWDYWDEENVTKTGLLEGKPGYMYYSTSGKLMQLNSASIEGPQEEPIEGEWHSPIIDLGEPKQKKRWSEVKVDYASGSATVATIVDGSIVTLPAYGNSIQVKISRQNQSTIIRGIEIQYRRMEGKR